MTCESIEVSQKKKLTGWMMIHVSCNLTNGFELCVVSHWNASHGWIQLGSLKVVYQTVQCVNVIVVHMVPKTPAQTPVLPVPFVNYFSPLLFQRKIPSFHACAKRKKKKKKRE